LSTTEGSLLGFRLNEWNAAISANIVVTSISRPLARPATGDGRSRRVQRNLRSGLRPEHASIAFEWGSYSDFKSICGSVKTASPHP